VAKIVTAAPQKQKPRPFRVGLPGGDSYAAGAAVRRSRAGRAPGMQRRAGTTVVTIRVHAFANGLQRVVMTDNARKEPRDASGMVLSLRARIGRYREQAARFTRLAEGEEDATFRDKWVNLSRECESLAKRLHKRTSRRAQGGRLTRGSQRA
jgi:hypothetical protein